MDMSTAPRFMQDLLTRLFELRTGRTTSMADAGYRVPATHYTDTARFLRESKALFHDAPLVAGLSCDLPQPGTFFTLDLGSVPVLVVRDQAGHVRAFLNACRHRGSPVLSGRGQTSRGFACPYHAWSYDLGGKLIARPTAKDAFADVDPSCAGLVGLDCAEVSGLILVRPVVTPEGGQPIDGGALLSGMESELSDRGFDGLTFFAEDQSEWAMNWKQPYETFLEAYHIFALHKESLARVILSAPMLTDTFGPHGRGLLMGHAAKGLLEQEVDAWTFEGRANLVYWLFPNSVISMPMTGHVEHWQFFPHEERPDRTQVLVRFYVPGDTPSDDKRAYWKRLVDFSLRVVTSEDFAQQVKIYKGLRSALLPELHFGRNEPALIHFHRSIERALEASEAGR